jgi:hypothetical protein
LHRHEYDYHFVVLSPSQLEVTGENGIKLFDFRAEGTFGLRLVGDKLVPHVGSMGAIPAVHAVKNIGDQLFHEYVFESKSTTNITWPRPPSLLKRAQNWMKALAARSKSKKGEL